MSTATPRYRFAPSPTGYFHVGGARTALYNWLLALKNNGIFVLRIEDTDESRNEPQWTQGIIDALAWIGIDSNDPHFEGPYFQSTYAAEHVAAAQKLFDSGNAYYCDQTSEQIQERAKAAGLNGYDGHSRDRGLAAGPGHVLRFKVPAGKTIVHDTVRGEVEFENSTIEDFVLLRGNGTPVFLLANVVDDITMKISHVLRAEEHLPNTPKQQMLWSALGVTPPVWAHVPVLVNEQRKKLSKRRDKVAVEQYREEGILPQAMVNYLMTLGWAPQGETEIVPWSTIERDFKLEDVNHSPAFFDLKKLAAFNGEYIRAMSTDEFFTAAQPFLVGEDIPWTPAQFDEEKFRAMAPLAQTRLVLMTELPMLVDFLFLDEPLIDEDSWKKTFGSPDGVEMLNDAIAALSTGLDWNHDSLKLCIEATGAARGLKLGKAQAPIRVAVTGRTIGPPLFEALELMGEEQVMKRLRAAAERLASA